MTKRMIDALGPLLALPNSKTNKTKQNLRHNLYPCVQYSHPSFANIEFRNVQMWQYVRRRLYRQSWKGEILGRRGERVRGRKPSPGLFFFHLVAITGTSLPARGIETSLSSAFRSCEKHLGESLTGAAKFPWTTPNIKSFSFRVAWSSEFTTY